MVFCGLVSVGSALAEEVTRAPPSLQGLGPAAQGAVVAVVMVRGRGRGRVSEGGRDYRGLDWDDPGVHHLTVHLHHHLIAALRRVIHRIYTQTHTHTGHNIDSHLIQTTLNYSCITISTPLNFLSVIIARCLCILQAFHYLALVMISDVKGLNPSIRTLP